MAGDAGGSGLRRDGAGWVAQLGTFALARIGKSAPLATVLLGAALGASCGGATTNDPQQLAAPTDGGNHDELPSSEASPSVRPDWIEPDVDTTPVPCDPNGSPETRTVAATCSGGCGAYAPPPRQSNSWGECGHASDCRDGVNGSCATPAWSPSFCVYDECFSDDDCASNEVCICGVGNLYSQNTCLQATCRTTDDCDAGQACTLMAMPSSHTCSTQRQFHCTSAADECETAGDCPRADSTALWVDCVFDSAVGHRACQAKMICPL